MQIGTGTSGSGMSSLLLFRTLQHSGDAQKQQFAKQPQMQREIDYFLENAKKIESPEDFFKDRRLMQVALGAFGLEQELNYTARIKTIMTEDPAAKESLVNRMAEPRYKQISEAFDFSGSGVEKLKDEKFLKEITGKYLTNQFEKNLGGGNESLREAAYFRRKVAEVAEDGDIYKLMGDKVLRSVITDTLRIPKEIVNQSLERQAKVIESKVKPEDFKDPAFVDKFLARFLTQKDAEAQLANMGGGSFGSSGQIALQLLQGGNLNILV